MKYSIDINSKESAYIQLYKQIRHDIINSVYKFGDRLPSKRMLAEETMSSVITVEHAYEILCDEGYVESRERSGYFAAYFGFRFLQNKVTNISARIVSGIVAELIMVFGYYVFEGFLYGFGASLVNIPANAVQGVAGLIIGTILVKIFEKSKIIKTEV